jgi:hypothetical protein
VSGSYTDGRTDISINTKTDALSSNRMSASKILILKLIAGLFRFPYLSLFRGLFEASWRTVGKKYTILVGSFFGDVHHLQDQKGDERIILGLTLELL